MSVSSQDESEKGTKPNDSFYNQEKVIVTSYSTLCLGITSNFLVNFIFYSKINISSYQHFTANITGILVIILYTCPILSSFTNLRIYGILVDTF